MSLRALFFLFILGLNFVSCNTPKVSNTEPSDSLLIRFGDSVAQEMQRVLLQNVAQAIQKGGTDFAVSFCNMRAPQLTDSISKRHYTTVQRLTDRNRNPENYLKTATDSMAWEKITTGERYFIEQEQDGNKYFYKPIFVAMPTCISCHGNANDIAESTHKIITNKYPNDKATGYKQGDLRGMWKILVQKDK